MALLGKIFKNKKYCFVKYFFIIFALSITNQPVFCQLTLSNRVTGANNWSVVNTWETGALNNSVITTGVTVTFNSTTNGIAPNDLIYNNTGALVGTVLSVIPGVSVTLTGNATANAAANTIRVRRVPALADIVNVNGTANTTITVDGTYSCNNLTMTTGTNNVNITVIVTAGNSLSANAVNINNTAGGGTNMVRIDVAGNFNCNSLSQGNTGGNNQDVELRISGGNADIAGNISFAGAATENAVTFNPGGTLNIAGNFTGAGAFNSGTGTVNYYGTNVQTVAAYNYYNLTLSGARTVNNITLAAGTIGIANIFDFSGVSFTSGDYINTGNTIAFNGTGAQFIPGFNYGGLTISGARTTNSITFDNTRIIGIAGVFTPSATFSTGGWIIAGSTIDFNANAAQTIPAFQYYYNLNISNINPLAAAAVNKSLGGAITVNADLNITGVDAIPTVSLQLAGNNITVNGTTNINSYGILSDNALAGTNTFIGLVDIKANGSWTTTNNPPFTFRGGINFDGSGFNSGTGNYTFTTSNQTISGSQALTISNIVVTGVNLTNTIIPGLTVGTLLSGTGTFINGDASNNAKLYLSGTGNPITITGRNFTSNPNTLEYNFTGAQTIAANDFYNLIISGNRGGAAVTLANGGTIRVSNQFSPTAINNIWTTTNNTFEFNGSAPQNIAAFNFNNLIISGGSTKTLVGNVNIGSAASGTLNLNGGVLELDAYNLTIQTAATITSGAFSSLNMISTNSTGYLRKNGNTAAGYQTTYPIGSNGFYSPMIISNAGTIVPTYITVRAVPVAINPSYILKYWDVNANAALNNVTATFQFDPAELNGAATSISYSPDWGITWQNPPTSGVSSFGGNSFTITGNNPFRGYWTQGLRTFYSYQDGNWSDFSTWTSDPSGTLQLGNSVPAANDLVVILPGRTVTLTEDVAASGIDLTINDGGILNLSTYTFSAGLQALRGQGTLRLSSSNFPNATTNTFINTGGGTTEYNDNVTLSVTQNTYNNLKINTAGSVIQVNDLTLNGNLVVTSGTFQINDNTTAARRQLVVYGDVTVEEFGNIRVGTGVTNTQTSPIGIATTLPAPFINYYDQQSHRVVIYGDFTNNGSVRFTNLTFPIYNSFPPIVLGSGTTGFATVYFLGATNNTLTCNGQTDFYNLVIDKGSDQSFGLTINSNDYADFRLFGANIAGGDQTAPATAANPNLKKALWLRNGKLILQGNLVIPSLSEGNNATVSVNFIIPANAALIIDGVDVIVQSTADSYDEVNAAYGVSGGSGTVNGVITNPNESGILVLGKLRVNNGFLSTKESRGILYSNIVAGEIDFNGGTIDAKQFRSINPGTGLISYNQSGGTLLLRGRFQRTPSVYSQAGDLSAAPLNLARLNDAALLNTAGTFSIENTSDVFTLSGGTIRIYDVPAPGATSRAYDILTSSANYNVSGGNIELLPTAGTGGTADATPWLISTSAPVYNFLINRISSASEVQLNTGYPLNVTNNLNLQSGPFLANNLDVTVGGNFTIQSAAGYTAGTNTTTFNGSGTQSFTINLGTALTLNNFTVNKPATKILTLNGSQGTIDITGAFNLYTGTLNDNGTTLNVAGNVYNNGVHSGTGKISLNGTNTQTINGDGNGIFQNLELNNTNAAAAPISLTNNITINGILTFSQAKLFNIGTYNLKLNSSASISNANSTRYVQTTGNLGDGGITKVYSSTGAFNFPLGVVNYTPASIGFNIAPSVYGSITIVPVNYAHPNVTLAGRSLSYFWRVKSNGFTLGSATLTHGYTYNDANVVTGAGITEAEYVAARYNPSTYSWTRGNTNDVDEAGNIIGEPGTGNFLENVTFIDGDYTAGDDNPTNPFGTPAIFYSRQNGNWGTPATWSLTSHTVTNPPAVAPGANDIVIIGNGNNITFETPANYLTNPNTAPHSCASLQIEAGSTLDTRFNPSSTFSVIRSHPNGNGKIRVAADYDTYTTIAFPLGDFSDFNQNLGTTELYSTNPIAGTEYYLPNGVRSYGNLIVSPLGGSNIMFPNHDLTIYGNLIINGQNADSWFCPTWDNNYPTAPAARVSKTITIMGDFDIQGGSFGWYGGGGGGNQNVVVYGDVIVAPGAGIDVWSPNTSQSLSIGGSLINNSNNTTAPNGTVSLVDLALVPVTFFGSNNASITNTASNPPTTFGNVTVNKGNSQATTLTIDITGTLTTPNNNWLTLQNGTLRYVRNNPNSDFTVSTTTPFSIPATTGLYINLPSNTGNRTILIGNANNNNGDLILDGKLTVGNNSRVFIGPTAGGTNNNDVIYSGSGASEILVESGLLSINGQIRRSGTSGGVLRYTQNGGTVSVYGVAYNATNAKLEILNSGSQFNMSGTAVLNFYRGGGTSAYGDLYLRPENSAVTGGTINFLRAGNTAADQTYSVDVNIPLNNITITGSGAAPNQSIVSLKVNPLVLLGNLTLSNTNSLLTTNNLNLTIGGNFTNSGSYTCGTNTTTFNGNTQSVTGTIPNFYNLVVAPVTSLTTTANNYTVNRNLSINSGNLILNNRLITLLGNLSVIGSYTDDNINGGITLGPGSTSQHQISGTGSFGRLALNTNYGAKLLNDVNLQNNLVLTLGKFDIGSNQLLLGLNCSIGGSPFSLSNYIVSDGVLSSKGVRKFFPVITGPTNFVFPVGVSGKYTPATASIIANGAVGYLNINPVNNTHPTVLDNTKVLKYYWTVESSGITGFEGSLVYKYLSSDVQDVESNYIAARLLTPGTYWSKSTPGPLTDNVDESTQQITFTMPAGTNNLSGDYTAGIDDAIPEEVPVYNSIIDGSWSDPNTWQPVGTSPPCPVGGPNGFIVNINTEVNTDINHCFAYKITINDKLKIVSPTYGHNLGLVDGGGTLYVESGNLPAGNFDIFLDCVLGGGTIEYGGSGNYTIAASQYNVAPNLVFSGSGTRYLPNKDLTICNRLVIDGPALDNSLNNKALHIQGTIERYNAGTFKSGSGATATVVFEGSAPQTVGGALGNFTTPNNFNNVEINNPNGLTLNGIINLNRTLILTNGIINVASPNFVNLLNASTSVVTPSGGSSSSFVNGMVRKQLNNGTSFLFPVGQGTTLGHPLTLTNSSGTACAWTVGYYMPNATAGNALAPLQSVNIDEYYAITSTVANRNAKVKIGWDSYSAITPLMTVNGISDMRVAMFDGTNWTEQASVTTGNDNIGDVETSGTINITTTPENFTTASITQAIARASLNPSGPVCGLATGIPIKFTSNVAIPLNYTLDYTINGVPQTTLNITTTSYTLATPSAGIYQLTGFTYNNGASTGVVDPTTVTVYNLPTASNAGLDQSLCGLSSATLDGNDPTPFTGLWTKVSGTGGTILSPTSYNSNFIGISGNTYVLQWTITNGLCRSSDNVVISFPVAPQRPSNFTAAAANVCQNGSGYVYTVPFTAGITYNWSYTGTGATINGSGNSVTVDFSGSATSGNIQVSATNGCGTSAVRSTSVTVRAHPSASVLTASDAGICNATSTALQVTITGGTSPYSVVIANAGTTNNYISGNNISISPLSTTSYSLTSVTDIYGCVSTGLSGSPAVTVYPVLSYGSLVNSNETICNGDNPSNILMQNAPDGSASFNYQWYYQDGIIADPSGSSTVGWTSISGANNSSYDPPAGLNLSRTYALMVTPSGTPTCGSANWAGGARQITVLSAVNYGTINSADETLCSPANPASISFSTAAAGSTNFDYQWYYQDGIVASPSGSSTLGWTSIADATSDNYDPPSGLTTSHTYAVMVIPAGTPTCGTNTWATGSRQITVNTAPSVSVDPSDSTIFAGANSSFSVSASGTGLNYSWEENQGSGWNTLVNGGVYSNATTSTLNITNAPLSMDGYLYRCSISGSCPPSVNSNTASLLVNPTATVTLTASSTNICEGETSSLIFTLTGTPPWSIIYNGTTVNGILASPYNIVISPSAGISSYTVTDVSDINGAGTVDAVNYSVDINVAKKPASSVLYRLPNK